LKWNFDHDQQEGFIQRFKPLFPKLGITDGSIQQSIQREEKRKQDENKQSFFMFAIIAIVVSGIIAYRMSKGDSDDLAADLSEGRSHDF
jgi:hypothetical protein